MLRKAATETEQILIENMSVKDKKEFNRLLQAALDSMNDTKKTSKGEVAETHEQ